MNTKIFVVYRPDDRQQTFNKLMQKYDRDVVIASSGMGKIETQFETIRLITNAKDLRGERDFKILAFDHWTENRTPKEVEEILSTIKSRTIHPIEYFKEDNKIQFPPTNGEIGKPLGDYESGWYIDETGVELPYQLVGEIVFYRDNKGRKQQENRDKFCRKYPAVPIPRRRPQPPSFESMGHKTAKEVYNELVEHFTELIEYMIKNSEENKK